ncbi:MAG: hypothetical protein HC905_06545 [Bacteroidales bacterium]|nr:hypothetical protein [Bacteroidales bacterium]
MVLILGSGLAYLIIDVVYSLKGVISYIYLGDAALQILFMGIWVFWLIKIRFRLRFKHY